VSLIERAARALARRSCPPGGEAQFPYVSADEWEAKHWRDHIPAARAVIEAIREPSEGMVRAGHGHSLTINAGYLFKAMIDAALSEKPE
jgi:hypothetical protein